MPLSDLRNRLSDQIWATRISRVNAEKRLIGKESFIQAINIYYSCFTVLLSVILLQVHSKYLSYITIFMTIALLITLLYFKSLNYTEMALSYRKNYTQLQKLEFRISHIQDDSELEPIEQEYCKLLAEADNHSTFDYLCTIASSNEDFRKKRWNKLLACKYHWGRFWRFFLRIILVLLPIILILPIIIIGWGDLFDKLLESDTLGHLVSQIRFTGLF